MSQQQQQITKEVEITGELKDYVEKLHYEAQAARDIITYMISNNQSLETEAGKKFQRDFADITAKYEQAKQYLTEKFVPEEFKTPDFSWNLDFKKSVLAISKVR